MKKNIVLLGCGEFGSRHFQAIKSVTQKLDVYVIDPSSDSLRIARERYDAMPQGSVQHDIHFLSDMPSALPDIDVAIIATNSATRRDAIEQLLTCTNVSNIVLEKLLFSNRSDYDFAEKLFQKKGINAYVNLSMRIHPLYSSLIKTLSKETIFYHASGGNFGLVTNAIHYLAHCSEITQSKIITVNTDLLDRIPVPSKRKGFFEYNGTLEIIFDNRSQLFVTSYQNSAPCQVVIFGNRIRLISKENEGKSWIAQPETSWSWQEIPSKWPYQSEMTTTVIKNFLEGKNCPLVAYSKASELHLQLLEPLL